MAKFLVLFVLALVSLECITAFRFGPHHLRERFENAFNTEGKKSKVLEKSSWKTMQQVIRMDQWNLRTSWSNCGASGDPVRIVNLTITPDPIKVPGVLHVSAAVTIKEELSAPLKVDMNMEKKFFGRWIRIPCFEKKVGSCTYEDICELIHIKKGKPCPDPMPKYGIPCECPFKSGTFYLPASAFPLKSPSKSIPSWLENGDYKIQVVIGKSGKQVGCFRIELSLEMK